MDTKKSTKHLTLHTNDCTDTSTNQCLSRKRIDFNFKLSIPNLIPLGRYMRPRLPFDNLTYHLLYFTFSQSTQAGQKFIALSNTILSHKIVSK